MLQAVVVPLVIHPPSWQLTGHATQDPLIGWKPELQVSHVVVLLQEAQLAGHCALQLVVPDGWGANRVAQLSHWSVVVPAALVTWEHSRQLA